MLSSRRYFLLIFFTARRYASAVFAVVVCLLVCLSVTMSVRHKPVLYRNYWMNPAVCLSVCPTYRPLQAGAAGLLLWARRAGDIDRSTLAAAERYCSKCEQCHVVSRRRHRLA